MKITKSQSSIELTGTIVEPKREHICCGELLLHFIKLIWKDYATYCCLLGMLPNEVILNDGKYLIDNKLIFWTKPKR